ncbi:hypothetical protein CSB08_00320 [Candidatus Gracilibacteria bacterium]|nr:MAG: hypothetical protein CSB08_00320 [Candidatus Gracilibacteria bacterium]PIE85287.1 MAG: hypothetical protein CSA08_02670 [Candidatus Gracilibacteria bacterium]
MRNLDLSKIFGSKCRAKILEKLLLEYQSGNNDGFHMRLLARELDEQINSIKRELDNLSDIGILKSRSELKKKIFYVNKNFSLIEEFIEIFLKSYSPMNKIRSYFKSKIDLELVLVNEAVEYKLVETGSNILDIFMIGEIDKQDFNDFLAKTFYNRKVKYAIITTEDFFKRLEYGDKLIKNILTESGNIYIKDNLKIKEKLG